MKIKARVSNSLVMRKTEKLWPDWYIRKKYKHYKKWCKKYFHNVVPLRFDVWMDSCNIKML